MDRCDGCGFEYHEEAAPYAPGEIITGARALAAIMWLGWVAVHTLHEIWHHLQDVQRQL